MKDFLMRFHSPVALVLIVMASPFLQTAHAQCVDYSLSHRVGVPAPVNTGVVGAYNPILTLPSNTTRYTYSATGSVPVQNFFLVLNGYLSWTPLAPLPTAPNTVSFNFYIPTPQPLCSTKDIRVTFQRRTGNLPK